MRFKFKTLLLIALGVSLGVAAAYREDLIRTLGRFLADRSEARAKALVGQPLATTIQVRTADGRGPMPLVELFDRQPARLMTYHSRCAICVEALGDLAKSLASDRKPWPNWFVLMKDSDDELPSAVPSDHILFAIDDESPFHEFSVSPMFWDFDAEGRVLDYEIGYSGAPQIVRVERR